MDRRINREKVEHGGPHPAYIAARLKLSQSRACLIHSAAAFQILIRLKRLCSDIPPILGFGNVAAFSYELYNMHKLLAIRAES